MDRLKLRRVHSGEGTTVYEGTDMRKYMLRAVDRAFPGKRKPPTHYLLCEETPDSKPRYLSGLFPAGPGVLSGDVKDAFGVRQLFTLKVSDGGATAELVPGRAE